MQSQIVHCNELLAMERVVPGPSVSAKDVVAVVQLLAPSQVAILFTAHLQSTVCILFCLSHLALLNTSKRYSCNLPNPASPEATELQAKPQQAPQSGLQYDTQLPHTS